MDICCEIQDIFFFLFFPVWAADSPSCRARVAVFKAGRTRARTWEDVSVCFISNFFPHMYEIAHERCLIHSMCDKSPCGSSM